MFVGKTQRTQDIAMPVKSKQKRGVIRSIANVVILLVVFWVGLSVGNGTIGLTSGVTENRALPNDLDYGETERVYDLLRTNYDGKLDVAKLEDGLRSGLVKATGDPYTEYFNAKEAKEFNEQLSGTFSGIGAQLGKDDKEPK
jgi:carboxyl-terminal processing protease